MEERHPLFWVLVDMLVELVGSSDHFVTRRGATLLISRLWAKPITEFLQVGVIWCVRKRVTSERAGL